MKRTGQIIFPPFRLDPENEQLWRENQLVAMPPKTFAVLRFLVEHAGQLVTKEALLNGVWPDTKVSEGILKGYIHDLRDILQDEAQEPRFIKTVQRRGYRFIGQIISRQQSIAKTAHTEHGAPIKLGTPAPRLPRLTPLLVGREAELVHLHSLFTKALCGERQIVFVTGEPGIGKTSLVDNFLADLVSGSTVRVPSSPPSSAAQSSTLSPLSDLLDSAPWLGRGQCVEQHGAGEAYLPLLESLGRIGRSPDGGQFVAMLQQFAPTWLVQMPALIDAEQLEVLQRRVLGATRERMLREMIEAIEALTTQRPLVLWLEDLHWADAATVDWLAAVAQQPAPARLFVIGTYRPSDLSLSNHPLRAVKQELVAKGQCEEIVLPFLSAEAVSHYLTVRYPTHQFPEGLGPAIYLRTDGNPLFVVNMVEYMEAQGVITEGDGHWQLQTAVEEVGDSVPESLRQLIEKHLERLTEDQQRVLEVASVAGVTFSATAVAAGMEASVEQTEEWCDGLVKRGQFLQVQEPRWLPDGTQCETYGFLHALQHTVVYDRISSSRRLRLHRRVGDREERMYGPQAHEIASELAAHFERGQEYDKAAHYHHQAGLGALRRHANREAIGHFTQGITLLKPLSETPERLQLELQLQVALIAPTIMMVGYTTPALEHACARARLLCQHVTTPPSLFSILHGLFIFYMVRGELPAAQEMSTQFAQLAETTAEPVSILVAQGAAGTYHLYSGAFSNAHQCFRRVLTLYNSRQHGRLAFEMGDDPGVMYGALLTWTLWLLGYPDQARATVRQSQRLAQELGIPSLTGGALYTVMLLCHLNRRPDQVQELSAKTIQLEDESGRSYWGPTLQIFHGWALSCAGRSSEGMAQTAQGVQQLQTLGFALWRSYNLAILAETQLIAGYVEEGYRTVNEGLAAARQFGTHWYDAELYRLKGEIARQRVTQKSTIQQQKSKVLNPQSQIFDPNSEAEACFLQAVEIARHQQAKSLELRATISLARLWQQQGNPHEAHRMLSEIYNWYTEGFDTKDVQEAKVLLDELATISTSPVGGRSRGGLLK